ncbi:hypothetical protein NXO50_001944 [Enterococcus hirae]|uniref:Uncharacterized protein n=1 Tax=Enterococcus hirae TaxID=1354 RepID=A0AB37ILL6_ENTHR|nr:hypothetical protein [Enterococcus hirae]AND72786.1 hypothetical protein A6P53_07920 [Enterococcus hirae]EMF0149436.1 hypothetical protein [Enterococcus hirae]EMF0151141.1 hypothetical protein [Enterococcus hirae]EMF0192540.1 hypothetical protein [Enterococcus hirae]EMF0240401.1 hypothetical protein [Enterococcus hirae]
MAKLGIDELDLSIALIEEIRRIASEESERRASRFLDEYKEKMLLPNFRQMPIDSYCNFCLFMNDII